MARFTRLTWDDLKTHTRGQLLDRVEAEQAYWARKERGVLSEDDRKARDEFGKIVQAVVDVDGLSRSMREDAAWLRGERPTASGFWDEKPGSGGREQGQG